MSVQVIAHSVLECVCGWWKKLCRILVLVFEPVRNSTSSASTRTGTGTRNRTGMGYLR